MKESITLISSTKQKDEAFIDMMQNTCGIPLQTLIYENHGEFSLSEIYNRGLNESNNDIIVFSHDDVIMETDNWGRKLLLHFNTNPNYGILGVAGIDYMIDGCWWTLRERMVGIVKHTNGKEIWENTYSKEIGNKLYPTIMVDGVFFAVHKKRIEKRFDEDFKGFHFYDLGFCIPNWLEGVDIGVFTNIRILHLSVGQTNLEWEKNKKIFEKKYKDELPINYYNYD